MGHFCSRIVRLAIALDPEDEQTAITHPAQLQDDGRQGHSEALLPARLANPRVVRPIPLTPAHSSPRTNPGRVLQDPRHQDEAVNHRAPAD
jgi:hypothetical protein